MGLAGMSLGRELRAPSSEPHRFGAAWHRLRTRSQTRVQTCALTQQMIGCASRPSDQPLREERVGKAVPGLAHRVGAEWREERRTGAAAQVERAALCFRRLSCAQPGIRWVHS